MSWLSAYNDNCRDDAQYSSAVNKHNYAAWQIYYEAELPSIERQLMELNQQIRDISGMSLTATAAISPYQGQINSLYASNDLMSICVAQQMSGIVKGYSRGMKKNSADIKKVQEEVKRLNDRKRNLMRLNRNVMQSKETWQQSQRTQQSMNSLNSISSKPDLSNKQQDLQKDLESMSLKVKKMEDMLMNVQSHILQADGNNGGNNDDLDDEAQELKEWITDVVGLPQYFDTLMENGFENLESLSDLTKDDLKEINITKLGHQKKIIKEVSKLDLV